MLRATLETRRKLLPSDNPDIYRAESDLGAVLVQEGHYQQAEPLLLNAYQGFDKASEQYAPRKQEAKERLFQLYTAWNHAAPNTGKAKLVDQWKAATPDAK
jgi:hypothetical protein